MQSECNIFKSLIITICLICLIQVSVVHGLPVRPVVKEAAETITKLLGRRASTEAAEELAAYGGRKAVQETVKRVGREGGEEATEKLVRLTKQHGVDTLRAMDNAQQPAKVLRVIDDLPDDVAQKAIPRLAGQQGEELADLTARYGADVLKAEARHPGLGVRLADHLGEDGIALANKATQEQAVTISRHAEDIAELPAYQQERIVDLIRRKTDEMVKFIGHFVENNPGKVLFTTAVTGIILANDEKALGKSEIVYDDKGNPHVVEKSGMIERMFETLTTSLSYMLILILSIIALGIAAWVMIKLWYVRKREIKKTDNKE
jgi:hypothetical protein